MTDDSTSALVDVAARMESAFQAGLQGQLQWLEDAATALDAADLGDEGKAAATDLRAALGAVVHWSRGPQDPKTLPELEAVMRTFTTRGLATLYRVLAAHLRELADLRVAMRAACLEMASVFDALGKSVENGTRPPVDALKRLEAARRVF
jgi:hypothetical protein